jgi:hypothetical protein
LFQALIDSITCLILYYSGENLFKDWKIAFLGSLAYVFWPPALKHVTQIGTEILFNFLIVFLIYLIGISLMKTKYITGIFAGLIYGFSVLTRGTALPFMIVIILVIMWIFFKRKDQFLQTTIWFMTFVLSGVLIILPWVVRNYELANGRIILSATTSGISLWSATMVDNNFFTYPSDPYEQLDSGLLKCNYYEPDCNDIFKLAAFQNIKNDPIGFIKKTVTRSAVFWLFPFGPGFNADDWPFPESVIWVIQIPILCLFIIGMFKCVSDKDRNIFYIIIILFFIFMTGLHTVNHFERRYRFPVEGYMLLFSVNGLNFIINKYKLLKQKHSDGSKI